MKEEVHGHEVIRMILESGEGYTRDTLEAAIIARFGEKTSFHTCSASGMTAAEIIRFLEERGKFRPVAGGFTVDPSKVCSHEEPHQH